MKLPKLYALEKKLPIDLSLSENPLGCSPLVFAALKQNVKSICKYPDPTYSGLKIAFSQKLKIPKKMITFGNGSESLIDLICNILIKNGDEAIIPQVTFPLFEKATILNGGVAIFSPMTKDLGINLNAIARKISRKTKLVFLCNPNNPTGKTINKVAILNFIKEVSPCIVVVDEANIEFGGESVVSAVKDFDNLFVLRTFSKAYGLAGLRLGVLIAPEKVIKAVDEVKQPFPLNSLIESAACTALKDQQFIKISREFLNKERVFLASELRKRGFIVYASQTNNILAKVPLCSNKPRGFVRDLSANGVSVVKGGYFRGLGDNYFRLSPRLRKTNRQFLKIIDKILQER